MHKIVLYCKSYRGDFDRAVLLAESIKKYNKDNIPFFISVPNEDIEIFKAIDNAEIVSDESIVEGMQLRDRGWVIQQIVKSNFWKLGLCENYVMLDSDAQFIKPFFVSDFMFDEDTPYTVCHQQKELWNWSVLKTGMLGFDPKESFTRERLTIMEMFSRSGMVYDFGPIPVIWSTKVWKALDEVMQLNSLTFKDLMNICPSEFTWYGEALLYSECIRLMPIEPIFKVFHYHQQYVEYKQAGISLDQISQNYMGIVLQSNWPVKVLQY